MLSVFDIFRIGIGPSSSHTVGPMRAARTFCDALAMAGRLTAVTRIEVELYGSLALTGRGHGTDRAVVLGLAGERPEAVEPAAAEMIMTELRSGGTLPLLGRHRIAFVEARDLCFRSERTLPQHPNGMRFTAYGADGGPLDSGLWFSLGGGFIARAEEMGTAVGSGRGGARHPFTSAGELLAAADAAGLSVAGVVLANECCWQDEAAVGAGLDRLRTAFDASIDNGLAAEGVLPGGLQVRRRARAIHQALLAQERRNRQVPHMAMDWVGLFAMAVNEENAAGGRVVTAPTNGAAGVVPAVLRYYERFCPGASRQGAHAFLLTAGAIAMLFKLRASISGAEVGCQGEVGVACSMAAAGLAAALGGTGRQVENAAEIGMEHHLGLTCDPVGGLVQIPCIERNSMGAVKAVTAASLALNGDGSHRVSLDQVIETMRQTGRDMLSKYKETAQGGLAVTVVQC